MYLAGGFVKEQLVKEGATERACKSANLHTGQLLHAILQFHIALRARPTDELRARGTLDIGIVAESCWKFHRTTKWNVAHL
jgi:hypothetical protein